MTSVTIDEEQEILQSFVVECRDMLEESELQLIEIQEAVEESGALDDEAINTIFRMFHSIKGSTSLLNLDNIAKVTHEAEALLDLFRRRKTAFEKSHEDLLIRTCDVIRRLLDNVEKKAHDKGFDTEVQAITEELSGSRAASKDRGKQSRPSSNKQHKRPAPSIPTPADSTSAQTTDEMRLTITPEMVKQFIQESDEVLDTVEQSLIEIEKNPHNVDVVNSAFRSIHSFKGNCGFLGYSELEQLSHKVETVFGAMKSGAIAPTESDIGALLKIVDMIRSSVADLSNGKTGKIKGCELISQLMDEMLQGATDVTEPRKIGEILVEQVETTPQAVEEALAIQDRPLGEILIDMGAVTPQAIETALKQQKKEKDKMSVALQTDTQKVTRRDIRVDLDKLDNLINLVGELVISQAMVTHNPDLVGYDFKNFAKAVHHVERVTAELQDVAMSVRMIPVSGLFRKMIRLVHDLSNKCGKKIHLIRLGEDTEIDKTVIEHISDPLVHIIRNAIDHGIETVESRRALGKPETGTITLEAKHEGGEVLIALRDDGRGLNRDKILARAIERGLVTSDSKDMTDEDIYNYIFEPGFSTAAKVTNVSGRGVGMDVVKRNIEHLKGRVDIRSKKGQGTTVVLRIPLTLAIIDGMLVRVGKQRYTIPILAIKESFRPDSQNITMTPDGQEIVSNHGALLPVVRLHNLYKVRPEYTQLHKGILITVEERQKAVCLFADEVLGQQQAVIKALSDYYIENARGVSGCTILGDGEVSLILDVKSLIEKAANKAS